MTKKVRFEVTCATCGKIKLVNKYNYKTKEHHFCNQDCYHKWFSEARKGTNRPVNKKRIEVKCKICGKPKLVTEFYYNKNATGNFFCSMECWGKYKTLYCTGENNPLYVERITVYCDWCGKEKKIKPSRLNTRKNHFCSQKCLASWMSKYQIGENCPAYKGRTVEIPCDNCRKIILKSVSNIERGRKSFCSKDCQNNYHSSRMKDEGNPNWKGGLVEVPCKRCGKNVSVIPSSTNVEKFCSRECLTKWNIENCSFIGENNPNWQGGISYEPYGPEFNGTLKQKIRDRDGHICQLCGKPENGTALAVHHIDYDKKNNSKNNLISLHNEEGLGCHSKTNFNRPYWTKHFQELLSEKYGYNYPKYGNFRNPL